MSSSSIFAIVPAAGVGARMKASMPKQYLSIQGKTILEHSIQKLLRHPRIAQVVVAISEDDPYFSELPVAADPRVVAVAGGAERADSVLSALNYLAEQTQALSAEWVLVHDAARPCVKQDDLNRLIEVGEKHPVGAILACPVRDTMKRGSDSAQITATVDRENLWHALTPQMFRLPQLRQALGQALSAKVRVTDEASAIEWFGFQPELVTGRSDNLKVTQPEDLALAEFYLSNNS